MRDDATRARYPMLTSRLGQWPNWAAPTAGAWSLLYGVLGLYWTLGGAGFPFGAEHDQDAQLSALAWVPPEGAPVIAGLGLTGALVALAIARSGGHVHARAPLLVPAWVACAVLLLVVPDYRVFVAVSYTPIILLGAPFGWPSGVNLRDAVPWPVANQLLCMVGGFCWGATALSHGRRVRGACAYCGRNATGGGWTTRTAAARWGRWAVAVAVAIPVTYALTRWAWAFGIPLGVTEGFLRQLDHEAPGILLAGAALATLGVVGAALTVGLVGRWGEVFPHWTPHLAGRRIPPALAIVPATLVAVLVTQAGLMYARLALAGAFPVDNPAAYAPELLWPAWGGALGAATLAYYLRRRGRCAQCGRG